MLHWILLILLDILYNEMLSFTNRERRVIASYNKRLKDVKFFERKVFIRDETFSTKIAFSAKKLNEVLYINIGFYRTNIPINLYSSLLKENSLLIFMPC